LTAADFEQLDLNDEWSDYEFEDMDEDGTSKEGEARMASQPPAKNKKVAANFVKRSKKF
jgi:hypothetical protein